MKTTKPERLWLLPVRNFDSNIELGYILEQYCKSQVTFCDLTFTFSYGLYYYLYDYPMSEMSDCCIGYKMKISNCQRFYNDLSGVIMGEGVQFVCFDFTF